MYYGTGACESGTVPIFKQFLIKANMRKQVKITPRVSNELLVKGLEKFREEGEFSIFRKTKEPFDKR